ncbi:hypothetical protein [Candidatus Accumulibacter aalborgensis]|uniref:hypothetical protein n=1 Tax=Candidatus Accumulibacter aalborgensis TaxID=1860102 RepID=UPI0016442618|nr:hypothetical protein [Candidatus Accumulibacter aalborgensis]
MRCLAFDLAPLAGDRHDEPPDTGAAVALWQASPIEKTKTRKNWRCSSTTAGNPRSRPDHSTPDRLPVRCLAFALAPPAGDRHDEPPDTGTVVAL